MRRHLGLERLLQRPARTFVLEPVQRRLLECRSLGLLRLDYPQHLGIGVPFADLPGTVVGWFQLGNVRRFRQRTPFHNLRSYQGTWFVRRVLQSEVSSVRSMRAVFLMGATAVATGCVVRATAIVPEAESQSATRGDVAPPDATPIEPLHGAPRHLFVEGPDLACERRSSGAYIWVLGGRDVLPGSAARSGDRVLRIGERRIASALDAFAEYNQMLRERRCDTFELERIDCSRAVATQTLVATVCPEVVSDAEAIAPSVVLLERNCRSIGFLANEEMSMRRIQELADASRADMVELRRAVGAAEFSRVQLTSDAFPPCGPQVDIVRGNNQAE